MAALPKPFNQLGVLDKLIPYPPYLFLLCANILSIALTQAENSKQIKGVAIGRHGVSFTHLFFANDSFFSFRVTIPPLPI